MDRDNTGTLFILFIYGIDSLRWEIVLTLCKLFIEIHSTLNCSSVIPTIPSILYSNRLVYVDMSPMWRVRVNRFIVQPGFHVERGIRFFSQQRSNGVSSLRLIVVETLTSPIRGLERRSYVDLKYNSHYNCLLLISQKIHNLSRQVSSSSSLNRL